MSAEPGDFESQGALSHAIVEGLRSSRQPVRFITELESAVLTRTPVGHADFERELARLEGAGELIVRPQYCADPHLAGTDLRLVALVEGESVEAALTSIDDKWQEWLKGYLANHRCT